MLAKIFLQCLPDLASGHKDHHLPLGRHLNAAKLLYRQGAFVDRYTPSKKRYVGPVDPTDEDISVRDTKRSQDSFLHFLPGGRCERQNGGRTKGLANLFETTILRSKISSPLVNAVGLVDHKKCGTKRPELLLLVSALNKEPLWAT